MRPRGFIDDCEKYGEAALLGWTVVRIVPRGKQSEWLAEGLALVERGLERCRATP